MPGVKTALLNDTAAALEAARADFQPTATAALVMVGTAIGAAFQVDGIIAKGAKGWGEKLRLHARSIARLAECNTSTTSRAARPC